MSNIVLETRPVGSVEGDFFVKSYQRGYRWGREEVVRLLEDIYGNGMGKNYYLQPVVIRREGNRLELIDGQQRLTTFFLIYQFLHINTNKFLNPPKFTIDYETRDKTKDFLDNLDLNRENENIDFFYIANAFKTINEWFSDKKQSDLTKLNEYLDENVKFIWYEVGDNVDSVDLFTRLNIGKIPLTSAELVKAMFLSRDNEDKISSSKQEEIALQWDNIEKSLHDDKLWYFLTNDSACNYQTRIDLILNLIANKQPNNKEKYFTFFKIDNMRKEKSLQEIWEEIQHTSLILNDWFENHELYHKIGYLITSGYMSLIELFNLSKGKDKETFIKHLDEKITESISIDDNYSDLTYEKSGDCDKITRLLILFNVESVRKNGEQTQWFPFDKFKERTSGKITWSLEHIHAQQSQKLKTIEEWHEWLKMHIESIKNLDIDNSILVKETQEAINDENLKRSKFEELFNKIYEKLTQQTKFDINSIANLALLNTEDNAALNNSTFDVKRNKIIEMDQNGKYIPFCTRMVFLKYYTPSNSSQLHFWGQKDMEAYINAINNVLNPYLNGNKVVFSDSEVN